jgi:DNA-binding NtrC family response regulator
MMRTHPNVLLLSTDSEEMSKWEDILCEHAVVKRVGSLLELEHQLESDVYDALFCGWSFHFGTWHDALRTVQQQCPELPVIIFCGNGGERQWVEVLEAGAFDLLVEPYHQRAVLPVLEHAVDSYEGRRLYRSPSRLRAVAS